MRARQRGRDERDLQNQFLRLDLQTFLARGVFALTICHLRQPAIGSMRPQTRWPYALRDDSEGEGKALPFASATRRVGLP